MNTWRVEVLPRVERRLVEILEYVRDNPLYNPDASLAVLEDFEAAKQVVERMGDRIPVGIHPVMRQRALRCVNFPNHRYYLIYRVQGDTAQIVRIGHFLEDPNKVLR